MSGILLIDDDDAVLSDLKRSVVDAVEGEVTVVTWQPIYKNVREAFDEVVGSDTDLVVTDYDLSRNEGGVFGDTITGWCQERAIPAALYARRIPPDSPNPSDLFELKIKRDKNMGQTIAALHQGFTRMRTRVSSTLDGDGPKSPAGVLASVLEAPNLEYEFAPYLQGLGESGGALTSLVQRTAPPGPEGQTPAGDRMRRLLSYVLGHVMVNSILRYPGPLLKLRALCAYLGTSDEEGGALVQILGEARYHGPFSSLEPLHWRLGVDDFLEPFLPTEGDVNPLVVRRQAAERALERQLATHECARCDGVNGGFYCPFTHRAVCERADCSIGSSSWIPTGATACRIELDFFEEWAPLLGF